MMPLQELPVTDFLRGSFLEQKLIELLDRTEEIDSFIYNIKEDKIHREVRSYRFGVSFNFNDVQNAHDIKRELDRIIFLIVYGSLT